MESVAPSAESIGLTEHEWLSGTRPDLNQRLYRMISGTKRDHPARRHFEQEVPQTEITDHHR
jgi:hypothetical protein